MWDTSDRPILPAEPFVAAMSLVSEGVVITDYVGAVIYQNGAAEEFHGSLGDEGVTDYLQNEGHGSWWLSNPFSKTEKVETPVALAKQGYFERDFVVRTAKPDLFIATYSGKPLLDKQGRPEFLIIVIKNVRKFIKE
jgi:hypothetical protein